MIVERIPLAAVLGSPIAHSKSPILHSYWLKKYSIKGHYIPIDAEPQNLNHILRAMSKMGFVGANITIPHKETILSFADQISDRAAIIGAVNTISFQPDGKIFADNTDGEGFLENILQHQPNWDFKRGAAVVLGAGGASRAVISALLHNSTPEIWVANRNKARAEKLMSDFGARIRVIDWHSAGHFISKASILVNATSLGMVGKPKLQIDLKSLSKETLVADLVYTPLETDLLLIAQQKGCKTVNGLGMLIHQAIPGFSRWFGKKPEANNEIRDLLLE